MLAAVLSTSCPGRTEVSIPSRQVREELGTTPAILEEPYSPIRHLAPIVCPPWFDRNKVIFVMLTFAFDAGGDETTPLLTAAGFASSVKVWDAFSAEWTARLQKDGIEFFRAVDLAHFRGPFEHWHDLPDREALRRGLCADFMGILKRHVYRRFACTIINKNFEELNAQLREEFALNAYSLAGRTCEKFARQWLVQEWTWPGKQTPVELVFEAGDRGKGKLQQRLMADFGVIPPVFKPKKDTVLEDGIVLAGFVPLQAANWFAYEMNLATQKFYDGKLESESQLRWQMQEFLRYPPGHMGIYTPENIAEMGSMIELNKKIIEWEVATGLAKKTPAGGTL